MVLDIRLLLAVATGEATMNGDSSNPERSGLVKQVLVIRKSPFRADS